MIQAHKLLYLIFKTGLTSQHYSPFSCDTTKSPGGLGIEQSLMVEKVFLVSPMKHPQKRSIVISAWGENQHAN